MIDPRLDYDPLQKCPEIAMITTYRRYRFPNDRVRVIETIVEMPGCHQLIEYTLPECKIERNELYIGIIKFQKFDEAWDYWRKWCAFSFDEISKIYRDKIEKSNASVSVDIFGQVADRPSHYN